MAYWFRPLMLLAACLGLAACAGQPEIPFDRSSAGAIKTIGILTPGFPNEPSVILASTVGQSFGLIGALIDAGMESNRDSAFSGLLAGQHFTAADAFSGRLAAALQAQGYSVVAISTAPVRTDFLEDYAIAAGAKVDAYLDVVVIGYGYMAAGIGSSTPYRPSFIARSKLVRAADRAVLMQDIIVYNPLGKASNVVTIAPDPAYQFETFDTLMADPQKTVAGLNGAITQTADAIGTLLR